MLRLISALVSMACIGVTCEVRAQAAPAPTSAPAPNPTRDRSGVVLVEQAGRVLALGIILNDDGRILTVASRLDATAAGPIFVRYADGKMVQARIGHADRERDLALLVPKTIATRKGILAARSNAPHAGTALPGFTSGPNRSVTPLDYTVKNVQPVGRALVLELAPVPKAVDVGAPLLDARGHAVAIVVGGCLGPLAQPASTAPPGAPAQLPTPTDPKSAPPDVGSAPAKPSLPAPGAPSAGSGPCSKSPVGLPVAAVRSFLRGLPPGAEPQAPWLGIDGISADTGVVRGIRIGRVEPKSPAAPLPLQVSTESLPGDILVAVGGTPVPTISALERALGGRAPGERVDLLVFGKDGYKLFQVRLADPSSRTPSP